MKYFVAVICLVAIIVFFGGCNKGTAKVTNANTITGTWELRQAQNGMMPTVEYAAGNKDILKFSGSMYEKYADGSLVKNGHYELIRDDFVEAAVGLVIPSGQFTNRIVFDNDLTSPKTFIEISNNKLTLLSGYFPLDSGSNMVYEKVENNHQ